MAKKKDSSNSRAGAQIEAMACQLNEYACLLAGIEEICRVEDVTVDALSIAARTCREINSGLGRAAFNLSKLACEGGAA